ncbi:MAG: hypothetical protein WCT04_09815 [Planctomycetota bacterium]
MWHNSARIDSPEVIKEFRRHFVKFNETCQNAITGIRGDARKVAQWLQMEQLPYWTSELRKSEEARLDARTKLSMEKNNENIYGKNSCIEERKVLRKAEARKEHAELKLRAVKKWMSMLDREIENQIGPVNNLASTLDNEFPRGLAQLDLLTEKLEEYFRLSAPDSGTV